MNKKGVRLIRIPKTCSLCRREESKFLCIIFNNDTQDRSSIVVCVDHFSRISSYYENHPTQTIIKSVVLDENSIGKLLIMPEDDESKENIHDILDDNNIPYEDVNANLR